MQRPQNEESTNLTVKAKNQEKDLLLVLGTERWVVQSLHKLSYADMYKVVQI